LVMNRKRFKRATHEKKKGIVGRKSDGLPVRGVSGKLNGVGRKKKRGPGEIPVRNGGEKKESGL